MLFLFETLWRIFAAIMYIFMSLDITIAEVDTIIDAIIDVMVLVPMRRHLLCAFVCQWATAAMGCVLPLFIVAMDGAC